MGIGVITHPLPGSPTVGETLRKPHWVPGNLVPPITGSYLWVVLNTAAGKMTSVVWAEPAAQSSCLGGTDMKMGKRISF